MIREKDLSEKAYCAFITDILSIQRINKVILHSFPEAAEKFRTDLHLPFSAFVKLFVPSADTARTDADLYNGSVPNLHEKYPHIQRIGTSVHSIKDAVFAEKHGADYITAGHIFTTNSKKEIPGRGIDWLKSVCDAVSIPVYAIGGISDENISLLSDCGIAGCCMMSESMRPTSL